MSKKIDWIKGIPYTAFRFDLPKGYAINVTVAQHQSDRVTIRQSISKLIGTFNDIMRGIRHLGTDAYDKFFDKFNEVVVEDQEVS